MTGVLVLPAPGQQPRLPFWRGDGVGRPPELGAAVGAFTGELARAGPRRFRRALPETGFDDFATDNLWQLLDEQRQATGVVPTDATLVVGAVPRRAGRLAAPPALPLRAAGARSAGTRGVARTCTERYSIDEKPTASDDGIIVRAARHRRKAARGGHFRTSRPTRSNRSSPPKWAGRRCSHPGSGNALPAPCCCPGGIPGKRSPLWHRRQRAAQLLDVARKYPDFPIVLETVRECLQDVLRRARADPI